MLASFPASMLNRKPSNLEILNRFKLGLVPCLGGIEPRVRYAAV